MYIPVLSQKSCARGWLAAISSIADAKEGYNVVIDIDSPTDYDELDNDAITMVDQFLREHGKNPISTVANTIFPQALYERHGVPDFYDKYLEGYDRLSETKRWGRYFERMTRHSKLDGTTYNPLQDLIEKIKTQVNGERCFKSAYELAVYDPLLDGRTLRGGQCLSFLSFKVHPEKGLMLTAMYRNHAYITRCLGNLVGLGRLQSFIAKEADIDVGSLTCISTHAELDTGEGWGVRDARELVRNIASTLPLRESQVNLLAN